MTSPIPASPGARRLGPATAVFCRIAARAQHVPQMHLFTTLGRHPRLLWSWLPFSGMLLRGGRLATADTELTILRVAHRRGSEYELQHHRRLARRAGLDEHAQAAIFAGAADPGLTERQRVLVAAVDELLDTRTLSDAARAALAGVLDDRRVIEFVTLTTQYDALAATLSALRVPLDLPR